MVSYNKEKERILQAFEDLLRCFGVLRSLLEILSLSQTRFVLDKRSAYKGAVIPLFSVEGYYERNFFCDKFLMMLTDLFREMNRHGCAINQIYNRNYWDELSEEKELIKSNLLSLYYRILNISKKFDLEIVRKR